MKYTFLRYSIAQNEFEIDEKIITTKGKMSVQLQNSHFFVKNYTILKDNWNTEDERKF